MAASRSRPNPAYVLAKLIGAIVVTGVLAAGIVLPYVGGLGLAAKHEADKFLAKTCTLPDAAPPQKSHIYASDGKTLIATIFKQDRQPVTLDRVPKPLQQALIATEDRRFYSHHGVDLRGLIRSAVSTSGGDTQGGSTLTMQYVKQVRYYEAGDNLAKQQAAIAQNIDRKIEDAKCALEIETKQSKAQILDNYLNIAFFGENSYGIQTAARTYFNSDVSKLTVPQSAMLVGLLRAPSDYDPFENPEAAKTRRDQVLQNMVATHDLTQEEADKYKATPISLATDAPPALREGCANSQSKITNVGFFCDYVVNYLLDHKVVTEAQLQTGGLNIVTTLDARLQVGMQAQLSKTLSSKSAMTAIMPVIQPSGANAGAILAMATTRKYGNDTGETTLPIFTSYTAQGASTYKLFPLLTALQTGVPADLQLKTPNANTVANYTSYPWDKCPKDSNGNVTNADANETFDNNETMTSATAKSSNTYFTGLADQIFSCQLQPIIDMARSLGMKSFDQPSGDNGLSVSEQIMRYSAAKLLVLGDIATSPLELTNAYATIANDGVYNPPRAVESVTVQATGQSLFKANNTGRNQVVSPEVAREAVQILTGDTITNGSTIGTSAKQFEGWYNGSNKSLIAGKTGTAPGIDPKTKKDDKNGALWFVGMTPTMVATTALINLDHPGAPASNLPGVGKPADNAYGAYAAGIWLKALTPRLKVTKPWTWSSPEQVNGIDVPLQPGMTVDEAKAALKSVGLKFTELGGSANPVVCASKEPSGSIAFFGPSIAQRGTKVTVCTSTGFPQDVWTKPPPPPPPPPVVTTKPKTTGASSGAGSSSQSSPAPGGNSSSRSAGNGRGGGNSHGPGNGGGGGGNR